MKTPANGDHIRLSKVRSGSVYRVEGRTRKHLKVRRIEDGVPALVDRGELDRWETVWKCKRGFEGLTPDPPGLVRVDRARACGGRG